MEVVCNVRRLDEDEAAFKRKALRDAVICIGWLKLMSVMCYVFLYFLIYAHSKGHMSTVLQIMTLSTIPAQVLLGMLLFLGALEENLIALELSLWLALLLASYNTVLGLMGGIYFIRTGHMTMHFLIAVLFGLLALSVFTVICHDVLIIYSYKALLSCSPRTTSVA